MKEDKESEIKQLNEYIGKTVDILKMKFVELQQKRDKFKEDKEILYRIQFLGKVLNSSIRFFVQNKIKYIPEKR